ncbi:MAG: hypothetical protein KIT69_16380 [Propionibacteriaceae bacterium]|nr:hypothetical protein [Propionibacteriaceae bacterium]
MRAAGYYLGALGHVEQEVEDPLEILGSASTVLDDDDVHRLIGGVTAGLLVKRRADIYPRRRCQPPAQQSSLLQADLHR